MNASPSRLAASTLTVIAAAALMAACSPRVDGPTAGEKLDATVAKVEQKAAELKADVTAKTEQGTANVSDKVKDAAITTAVKGQLLADPQLSVLQIEVETVGGTVMLRGTAPTEASREHATLLASRVDGVADVDNQLIVGPKS